MDRIITSALVMVMVCVVSGIFTQTEATETEHSLVSFPSGALVVQKPPEYSDS